MNAIDNSRLPLPQVHKHILGLVGYPLSHSKSSIIHQAALDAFGLAGAFHLYPINPDTEGESGVSQLLERVRCREIQGLNITIPYKQVVMAHVDDLTPTARAIGAVNTIYLERGRLVGDNTDGLGFWIDLNRALGLVVCTETCSLILGAGGSARAVAYMLLEAGSRILVAARREQQSRQLASQFPEYSDQISIQDFRSLGRLISSPDLVVNTTPVGMYPNVQASPWPDDVPLPIEARVYDLVYNPLESKLVKEARERGHQAVTGLGMLVEQAAQSFERWTGLTVPRKVMMDAAYE
jgi:shikimate dehydrogenase